MLSGRAGNVLNILVNEYIHTAAPVASEDIARLSPTRVSPATIRSTMSQLTDEGYISRPHISAGGVPSERGYRYYVESLEAPVELPDRMQRQILEYFYQVEPDVVTWSQRCAAILSRITTNMAIVTAPRAPSPRLKHAQLVHIQEFLALLVVVLQEARILRRLLHLEEAVSQDQLNQVVNKLNEYLGGLDYGEIETNPLELMPLEDRVKHEIVGMLHEAETDALLEHYVDGLRLLLNQPEFAQGHRARELVEMVEEKVLLESILAETPQSGSVAVYIGEENREEALRPFGVIMSRYGVPHRASGTICVIGPTRMSYAESISGVSYLSSLMSQLVSELHRQ
jgi:heat-inducible transcriptional repressor